MEETPIVIGKFMITFHSKCFFCAKCSEKLDPQQNFRYKANDLFHEACFGT